MDLTSTGNRSPAFTPLDFPDSICGLVTSQESISNQVSREMSRCRLKYSAEASESKESKSSNRCTYSQYWLSWRQVTYSDPSSTAVLHCLIPMMSIRMPMTHADAALWVDPMVGVSLRYYHCLSE